MEKFPNLDNKESNESPEERHNEWLTQARIMLEGVGFQVVVGTSAYYILKNLGVELPPYMLAALSTPAAIGYIARRNKSLNKQDD